MTEQKNFADEVNDAIDSITLPDPVETVERLVTEGEEPAPLDAAAANFADGMLADMTEEEVMEEFAGHLLQARVQRIRDSFSAYAPELAQAVESWLASNTLDLRHTIDMCQQYYAAGYRAALEGLPIDAPTEVIGVRFNRYLNHNVLPFEFRISALNAPAPATEEYTAPVKAADWVAEHGDEIDQTGFPQGEAAAGSFSTNIDDTTEEDQKRALDIGVLHNGEGFDIPNYKEPATREDYSDLTREELELKMSEASAVIQSQASRDKRGELAIGLWDEAAGIFNTFLAGQPENQLEAPLIDRFKLLCKRWAGEIGTTGTDATALVQEQPEVAADENDTGGADRA